MWIRLISGELKEIKSIDTTMSMDDFIHKVFIPLNNKINGTFSRKDHDAVGFDFEGKRVMLKEIDHSLSLRELGMHSQCILSEVQSLHKGDLLYPNSSFILFEDDDENAEITTSSPRNSLHK